MRDAYGGLFRLGRLKADPAEDLVDALPVGMVLMHVAVSQVSLPDTGLFISHQVHEVVFGILPAPCDSDVPSEHPAHGGGFRGDDRCPARQAFEDSAGEHRWRVGHRVYVQHDVVAAVRGQHLLVGEGPPDRLPVPVREAIVRSEVEPREVAVEDVETVRDGGLQQVPERLGALGVPARHPASGKAYGVAWPASLP